MLQYDCSSKGDKRFSPLHAIINRYESKSIDYLYKTFIRSNGYSTEFSIRLYEDVWNTYFKENPKLLDELIEITETHELIASEVIKNEYDHSEVLTKIIKNRKEETTMARKKLADVADQGERLGIGAHEVTITGVEMTTTKKTNAPMAKLTMENDEGIVWDNLVMLETSLGFSKRYLSACGYDIDDLDYETGKGKAKEHVLFFYMENEKGEEEEWGIDQLLLEEKVIVTLKEGDKTYKDAATGDIITKDKPGVKITSIEAA